MPVAQVNEHSLVRPDVGDLVDRRSNMRAPSHAVLMLWMAVQASAKLANCGMTLTKMTTMRPTLTQARGPGAKGPSTF